ncbi:unnamed protein product [Brassica oleracea var. botrytis]
MADLFPPLVTAQIDDKPKVDEKVDYSNLPCPVPYDELHREAYMSLKTDNFEGFRFDFTKGLNQKFALCHSVMMGPTEVPSQSPDTTIKIPTAHYEFGANYADPKLMLVGRVMTDGRTSARVRADLTDKLMMKANAQITNEPHMSSAMFHFDYMGSDYRAQLQFGNSALIGANYIQSVTPRLSLGGEVFWAGGPRKSGIGYAARYETDKMVASGQVASTGLVLMNYVQKVSDKVSLATDFMYNVFSREAVASVGYDYMLRQARVRGKIDSNGVASALLEERLSMGLNFLISAEMTDRVIRHTKRLPQSRCSPFTNGTTDDVTKEKEQKEEAVRLGVELSLFMAEAMFILSDDRRSMTYFCFLTLFKTKMDRRGPAVRRLYRVIQQVYATYIKPKNLVYIDGGKSTQSKLMGTFRQDFVSAIRGLAHIVSTLEIGCLVKPSVFEQYNRELKKLEENLGSVKDVSESFGFAREAIESEILPLWKSLFETNSQVIKLDKTINSELLRPLLNELNKEICARSLASLVIKPGK